MRYVAYSGPDDYVESSDDLEELLAIVCRLVDPTFAEDVAIWEGESKLVAVVLENGAVIRFGSPECATERPSLLPFANGRAR